MLAIATNIPVLLMTGFVVQGHICYYIIVYYSSFYLHFTSAIACFLLIKLELQTKYCWLCVKLLVLYVDPSVLMACCTPAESE